jgi:hypothetical protein
MAVEPVKPNPPNASTTTAAVTVTQSAADKAAADKAAADKAAADKAAVDQRAGAAQARIDEERRMRDAASGKNDQALAAERAAEETRAQAVRDAPRPEAQNPPNYEDPIAVQQRNVDLRDQRASERIHIVHPELVRRGIADPVTGNILPPIG